jgi:hypothetical protein
MNTAVAETRKPIQQDLRHHLPRWMVVFVVLNLVSELLYLPTGRGLWHIPSLILISLLEGAVGGLVFVGMQRGLNPKDSRVVRIRNYVAAGIIVGIGSLWVMTAAFS